MRAELEQLPPASPGYAALAARYDQSTQEVNDDVLEACLYILRGKLIAARPDA
jgi:hypothetical protein